MSKKQLTICLAFLINGIMAVMTGTFITYFQKEGLSYTISGLIPSVQSAGNLIMGLCSGFLIYKYGRKSVSYLYCLCFCIGFSCILFPINLYLIFPLIFLSGLGWGLCNNVCHLIAAENSSSTVLLHCSYAIGAAIAPIIVKFSQLLNLSWRLNAWFVIIPSLLLMILIWTQTFDQEKQVEKKQDKIDLSFLKESRYYLIFLLYFFYNGVEGCINAWIITYLHASGLLSLGMAQTMLSTIWALIIVFRLFNILLLKYIPRHLLLPSELFGLVISLFLLTITSSSTAAILFVIFLGIFMAGISPCIAINAREFISGSGLSSGILFSGGGLGATILPAVTGVINDNASNPRMSMAFMTGCTCLLIILSFVNAVLLRKKQN